LAGLLALVEQHIRKPQDAYVLSEESRRPVAEAGLARIRSFFAKTPDLFSAVSGFAAIEWLWNWRRLLATVEADHLEVAVYLKKLLEARPSALSQVLSIAAGWSGEQPSYEHVAQKDVIDMFARLGMLDDVSRRAQAVSNTDADVGPYPYLVNAFLQRLGPPGSSGLWERKADAWSPQTRGCVVPDDQTADIAAKLDQLDRFIRQRLGDDIESRGVINTRGGFLEFDLAVRPTLQELEDEYIRHTLEYCAGNKTRAATILGIDPSTLHRKAARLV